MLPIKREHRPSSSKWAEHCAHQAAAVQRHHETARANARQGFPVGAAWMRSSAILMRAEILPAVDQLDKINQAYLDSQMPRTARA